MRCAEAEPFIHAFVDGEIAGIDRASLELHLLECEHCSRATRLQARFKAAVRGHLSPQPAPAALRQKIEAAISMEPPATRPRALRTYLGLAPAAAVAVAVILVATSARERRSPVIDQALRTYNAAMPLDVLDSNCGAVAKWFQGKLDFNFKAPLEDGKATCKGGRLVNVRDRLGAYIVYQAPGGHRLTYLVFDSDDELSAQRREVVGGQDVYLGSGRGASLAAYRGRDGLSYIVTSDLDEESLKGLVEQAVLRR